MHLKRLSLIGFKSFVEPVEFEIGPGTTGIVGPNGCGKSNIVESIRWIMGETSPRNVRANGMDDVIFDGTARRPARNIAEIRLLLANEDRKAPPIFNDSDEIEIVRRVQRERGSVFLVNGREVRARDLQLFFADSAIGARSHAIVSQGEIGRLISEKPTERRRLLEEAAGVAGIHARRHETELRLRATEENLERLDDVLSGQRSRLADLRRQARQAARYHSLSVRIRKAEARMALHRWHEAKAEEKKALADLSEAGQTVERLTAEAAKTSTGRAELQASLTLLRETEAETSVTLHKIATERTRIVEERKRLDTERTRIDTENKQAEGDLERERRNLLDVKKELKNLEKERNARTVDSGDNSNRIIKARAALDKARTRAKEAAEAEAEAMRVLARAESAVQAHERETAQRGEPQADNDLQDATNENNDVNIDEAEIAWSEAVGVCREVERKRGALDARLERLRAEEETLSKIVASGQAENTIGGQIEIKPDFERAVAAALGDDISASTSDAPVRWYDLGEIEGAPLPSGTKSLASVVKAPSALRRRLEHTGIVDCDKGDELQKDLLPGQRLVDRSGALWRWDGYAHTSEDSTPVARWFKQRNRLAEVRELLEATGSETAALREREEEAAVDAGRAGGRLRMALMTANKDIERRHQEADAARNTYETALALKERLEHAEASRSDQMASINAHFDGWTRRGEETGRHVVELERRIEEIERQRQNLASKPARIESDLAKLAEKITKAETAQSEAGDARAQCETMLRKVDGAAKEAEARLFEAREARARLEGVRDQAAQGLRHEKERIADRLKVRADEIESIAGVGEGETLPPAENLQRTLDRLERERENVGAVNLRAEEEANELAASIDTTDREREELITAINKLRHGVGSLNREARARLRGAFSVIDAHFRTIFTRLFGGGEARLELVDSDDPLEAGLELIASPPGKRLQKLSLLSGGEKALAALSLLFAMFLTRPAPLCVLDEVDAPLDDSNVGRFCDLLKEIVETSGTRLIVVTHHRLTMAKMDRLYGVTMREPGVSSLVSVNLAHAEGLREAS